MPEYQLRWFIEALPVLQAEESLVALNVAAVATGSVEQREGRKFIRALSQQAHPNAKPRRITAADFANLGVKVIDEKESPDS